MQYEHELPPKELRLERLVQEAERYGESTPRTVGHCLPNLVKEARVRERNPERVQNDGNGCPLLHNRMIRRETAPRLAANHIVVRFQVGNIADMVALKGTKAVQVMSASVRKVCGGRAALILVAVP